MLDRLRPGLPPRIRLELSIPDGLPPALCNPSQVELALGHILANACEAMAGEGTVSIRLVAIEPGDRTLQRPDAGAVALTVTDTGHGLSPEMQARALAPFATTREAGRGAGLAIVHGLMKRQNGTISIDSRPGEAPPCASSSRRRDETERHAGSGLKTRLARPHLREGGARPLSRW